MLVMAKDGRRLMHLSDHLNDINVRHVHNACMSLAMLTSGWCSGLLVMAKAIASE